MLRAPNLMHLRESAFLKNVLVVMSGTGIAQGIVLAFSPVISRLYGPAEFGVFGSFFSVALILTPLMTLQFWEALMLPAQDQVAARLFVASCAATLVSSCMMGVLFLLFPGFWLAQLRTPELQGWLWLIPVAALLCGLNLSLTAWCARQKAFKLNATTQVVRSLVLNGGQTGAGAAGFTGGGLIGSSLVADLLAAAWLVRRMLRAGVFLPPKLGGAREVLAAAREYRDFPKFSAPQNFLNALSQGAPVILLIHYYGALTGGLYAFSVRALQFPLNFVLTSLRQVLFQRLSETYNNGGRLSSEFTKGTLSLLAIVCVPSAIGFVFAPWFFSTIFGKEWLAAGECARWLLVWLVPGFCNLPASLIARILRQQRMLLVFDVLLLSSRLAVLVLGGLHWPAMQTIAVFSVVGGVFNSALILWVWRLTKSRGRAHPETAVPAQAAASISCP